MRTTRILVLPPCAHPPRGGRWIERISPHASPLYTATVRHFLSSLARVLFARSTRSATQLCAHGVECMVCDSTTACGCDSRRHPPGHPAAVTQDPEDPSSLGWSSKPPHTYAVRYLPLVRRSSKRSCRITGRIWWHGSETRLPARRSWGPASAHGRQRGRRKERPCQYRGVDSLCESAMSG